MGLQALTVCLGETELAGADPKNAPVRLRRAEAVSGVKADPTSALKTGGVIPDR